MNFQSKKTALVILGITALVLSRVLFFFFHDPEGPNLVVVIGMAVIMYLLSLVSYLFNLSNRKKFLLGIFVQLVVMIGVYFCLHTQPRNGSVGQQPVQLTDGRQCYAYTQEASSTAPYTVHEFLDITIKGNSVSGTKRGDQSGPDMTNGYSGTFTGTVEYSPSNPSGQVTGIFAYTIEGSKNKEEEIYQANLTGLQKMRYPLIERKGVLVPDLTQQASILLYPRVECEGSN